MRIFLAMMVSAALFASRGEEQSDKAEKAFDAIMEALSKTGAGGDKPTEEDLATRREAGRAAAEKARTFLREHQSSEKAEEASVFLSIGLFHAAVAGDTNSAVELQQRVREVLADAKASDEVREHTAVLDYKAKWAAKNWKRFVDESTIEGRNLWAEALLAAAKIVPKKERPLQHVLLLARSPDEKFSEEQRRELARAVLNHPGATQFLRDEASKILSGKAPYEIGKPIELKFTALDGREVDLAKLRGKVVLIDFWATWCGPCVAEFPKLKKTYEKYRDKGVEIIGVSLDNKRADLENFLKKNGPAPWPQYFDGKGWHNEISFRFGINGVPTLFVVDADGNLASTNPSYDGADDTIYVEQFLK